MLPPEEAASLLEEAISGERAAVLRRFRRPPRPQSGADVADALSSAASLLAPRCRASRPRVHGHRFLL